MSDSSDSDSDSDSDQGFTKRVVFKGKKKKEVVKVVENCSLAESIIAKNNSRVINESNVEGEAALVQHLDDSESSSDWEEWRVRELRRLHRDRNERLKREENGQ